MAKEAKYKNIAYLKELIKRFEGEVKGIEKADIPSDVSKCERTAFAILNEIQMVAPRIGDDMRVAAANSRKRIKEEA